ncbi:MAG: flagellar basal body P-ring protein FlgI [Planctomycetota bacterium]
MRIQIRLILVVLSMGMAFVATPNSTDATEVQEIARIKGRGESVIRGLGLVTGLPGTGDSGEELVVARPLIAMMQNNGNPVASVEELANGQSIALVSVTCTIPEDGAMIDDRLDVTVTTVHAATSLAGGELYLTALTGPYVGSETFAIASGPLRLEDGTPTRAKVTEGARMIRDVLPMPITGEFTLVVDEHRAGFGTTSEIAGAINAEYFNTPGGASQQIATPLNHREVRIDVPSAERVNPAPFIASVLGTAVNTDLLRLPAQVLINRRTGIINITGDVAITPGVVTVRGLSVTTTVPPIQPTIQNPVLEQQRWVPVGTGVDEAQNARLQDLLGALNRLDVPVDQQIDIIRALERNGQLHARLIVDG